MEKILKEINDNPFQFYLSSIKRYYLNASSKTFQCFNSTLVQLKVGNSERSRRNQQSFNSTLVQLKDD